jgi:molybdopterin-guanine dinucleotide biosynthesis protein A
MSLPPVSAVVLAGGKSARLGQDKRFLHLGSARSQLEETIARVSAVAEEVLIAVGPDSINLEAPLRSNFPTIHLVVDAVPGAGPLAGLCAALSAVAHERALVVACDLPLLNLATLRFLLARPRDYDLLVPRRADGRLEMLHAIYHRRCLDVLQRLLAADRLRLAGAVDDLVAAGRVVRYVEERDLAAADPDLLSFFNVNTPTDLATARRLIEGSA